ncbi:MAG: oxygen-dependent coproporphyrinogen oxidase [Flavobacteriales bacterium]|nr:oxygen-dependent coproporphyrinogen oxidase [Flavobacteriales bacterium]
MSIAQQDIIDGFRALQLRITAALEAEDGTGRFEEDAWQRPGGGGGHTRVLDRGAVIEKGGVNFSAVHGHLPVNIQRALGVDTSAFLATGVSIVIHPNSPLVPIIHMNVRYFGMEDGTWWFGGGIDLTPHYVVADDARFFHNRIKETCDRFDPAFYPKFKQWADDYFFIQHRKETRGIGGIFFDRLNEQSGHSKEQLWEFVLAVGDTFAPTYTALMALHKDMPFTEQQKEWQLLRRGRYVEFNLVYDKGTRFGLETEGRIESILMSLPRNVSWYYDHRPDEGSPEAETLALLRKGIDWAGQI